MSQDEIMVMMSNSNIREKVFAKLDLSWLLLEAARFKIKKTVMKQLSDFFVLGHFLWE
jgi:hypothetical protein